MIPLVVFDRLLLKFHLWFCTATKVKCRGETAMNVDYVAGVLVVREWGRRRGGGPVSLAVTFGDRHVINSSISQCQ